METFTKHILIVDDDEDDRHLIKQALHQCIIPVQIAELTDGMDIISYLDACPELLRPSLVLLDLNMPVVNGFEALNEIKKHPQHTALPVYVFSTSNSLRDKQHCIRLGALDVLVKPPSYSGWVDILCPIIDKRKTA
ncbi:MAG TPA: response regulator [Flavitalea sp.]|nr:response regulator [Flavitalea sp.]